jgi:2-polyprenyl-3-methyl-5-hydroxy-6-metoxy-1,4-benzoquinol methylase
VTRNLPSRLSRLLFPGILFYKNPFKIYEYNALLRAASIATHDVVLDLGCGAGKQTYCLANRAGRVIGIDPDAAAIQVAAGSRRQFSPRAPIEFKCTALPDPALAKGSIDRIMSFSVLEHIGNYSAVLSECRRLLKPDGLLVFSTDSLASIQDPALREQHRREHHVVKYFTADELRNLLIEVGFRTVSIYPLFKSVYARSLFAKGIRNGFVYTHAQAVAGYFRLCVHEALADRHDPGLFLVARCGK